MTDHAMCAGQGQSGTGSGVWLSVVGPRRRGWNGRGCKVGGLSSPSTDVILARVAEPGVRKVDRRNRNAVHVKMDSVASGRVAWQSQTCPCPILLPLTESPSVELVTQQASSGRQLG